MSNLPTFSDATERAQGVSKTVRSHGRELLPWLPDPFICEGCGAMCYASETFDPDQVAYVTSWECPECEQHYHRDPVYGDSVVSAPREGSPLVREWLRERNELPEDELE